MSFDFREYIEDNFPEAKPQQYNPDEISVHCINPDCSDNWRRQYKMSVNVNEGVAYCHKCGARYRTISFVAQAENISKFAALKIVKSAAPRRTYGVDRLQNALEKLAKLPEEPPEAPAAVKPVPCRFPPYRKILPGTEEWEYLENRRISQEVIDHFGLTYSHFGPYAGRIIIPVYKDGVAISFQARTIRDAKPKYLFPIDQPFDSELYNWDDAQYYGTILVSEGVTDAWRIWTHGYHNVTATFGKSLKVQQEILIKQNPRIEKVVFIWDGGTLPASYAAGCRLYPNKEVSIVQLPKGLDPDECPDTPYFIEHATPIQEIDKLTVALSKL